MNIEKAIEYLHAIVDSGEYEGTPFDRPAIELGIEALNRLQILRVDVPLQMKHMLPSETQD